MTPALLVLVPLALLGLVLGGVLAAADSAYHWVSRQSLEKAVSVRAVPVRERVLHQLEDNERTLAAIALGRILAEAVLAVAVTVLVHLRLQDWVLTALVGVVVTAVAMFIGLSSSPRTLGRVSAERTLIRSRHVIAAVRGLLWPPASLLIRIGRLFTPVAGAGRSPYSSAAQMRQSVDRALENEHVQDEQRDMIEGVFDLGGTLVRELMVPRTDMITIASDAPAEKAMRLFVRSGFSRIPVIGEDVDDLCGMLYLKDVVRAIHAPRNPAPDQPVGELMRPARFVPEFVTADAVMRQMQTSRVHIVVVVDEYGGVAGLLSIEDIVEEIVGEIDDEHDPREQKVEDLGDGRFRVPVRAGVGEVGELFDLDIDDEDVDTVGGLLTKTLGRVPIVGSRAEAHGLHLEAERTAGRRKRLSSIIVTRAPQPVEGRTPSRQENAHDH